MSMRFRSLIQFGASKAVLGDGRPSLCHRAPSRSMRGRRCARPLFAAVVAVISLAPLAGCAQRYVPYTDVIDTPENRQIVQFCEEYRKAVERRNVGMLMALAHPSYYEDGGNIDATDDLDYAGLREFLETKFRDTRGIRYEVRYRRVNPGPDDLIYVDMTYTGSYKLPTDEGDVWRREVHENRLELLPVKDSYKIVAGM